ncbi:hypothetical protein I547_4182 [Mycobacterium kansasii 824]|nr:hypothetical protein I547_4182 [Mycobacterium kansasii 824]
MRSGLGCTTPKSPPLVDEAHARPGTIRYDGIIVWSEPSKSGVISP